MRAGGQVHEQKSREAVQSFYSIQIKLFDRPQASDFSFSLPDSCFNDSCWDVKRFPTNKTKHAA